MDFGGDIDSIEGPSHAQGGIQMGVNAEVEGGEARAGDYIFSDQLEHPDFPKTLDSVLLEPHQFATHQNNTYTSNFKARVDTIINKTSKHAYLNFANLKLVKNKRTLKKIKSYKLHQIGKQHFY